ncbi:MAG TPA: hypothetical protein VD794_03460 [Flavisolibacter sp.]|nr:hypothetical protein [Flavisolibacter sp.]
MKQRNPTFWLLGLLIFIVSCSKSNEESEQNNGNPNNGGGSGTCNTSDMKFSADIVPILQSNCYACHSNANQSISGINLEGYSNVKARVDDGRLVGAITHASGFSPMPQGGSKLSDCNINKIKSWVASGAPNN